jgi:hypothetical protein
MHPTMMAGARVAPGAGHDSRLNVRNSVDARTRRNMIRVRYEGRKTRSGVPRIIVGEHIDLICPDENNAAYVERFLDAILPAGLTDEQVRERLGTLNPDNLHLSGQDYHFAIGEASDVFEEHWPFLKDHKTYRFSKLD